MKGVNTRIKLKDKPSGSIEEMKAKSSEGFDNAAKPIKTSPTMGDLMKWLLIAFAMIVAIATIRYLVISPDDGGTGVSGGQRNCILSSMGNPPDCSDNDGVAKPTYANGKYKGVCTGLTNSGACIQ